MINRKKKLFKIYFIILLFFFLIAVLGINNIKTYFKYSELNLQYKQVNSKIKNEMEKKEKIESKLEYLESEDGQVRTLIEKNNLKRLGEKVIKILDY